MSDESPRKKFLEGILTEEELEWAKDTGLYYCYIAGSWTLEDVYAEFKDQAE